VSGRTCHPPSRRPIRLQGNLGDNDEFSESTTEADDTGSPDEGEPAAQQDRLDPVDAAASTEEICHMWNGQLTQVPSAKAVLRGSRDEDETDGMGATSATADLRRSSRTRLCFGEVATKMRRMAWGHLNEPTTVREARAADDSVEWEAAMMEEMNELSHRT
jgi:hypothetical protein